MTAIGGAALENPRERELMERALAESWRARGVSSPNPPVGAVIVDRHGSVVGVGHTQPPGGPHAEVVALAAAGDRARGGTAVVTLEPCNHTGRTGPCTAALIAAGVVRVVYAVDDPNPQAAGGAKALRAAGISVQGGVGADAAENAALREWLHRQRTGRPYITAKIAASLDGRIAAPDGTSQWITGPTARRFSHVVRSHHDAIVVGTGTVLADNPTLTARTETGLAAHQPTRVVVGNRPIPADFAVRNDLAPTIFVPGHDPLDVLRALPDAVAVLLEGGPGLIGAFLTAGLVDRIHWYSAPVILGAGPAALDLPVTTLGEASRWRREWVTDVAPDLMFTLVPQLPSPTPADSDPGVNAAGDGAT